MSAQTAIVRGRRAAEALMVDACEIRRRTGEATDPNSGVITPTYVQMYSGKCRLQQRQLGGQGQNVGEAYVIVVRYELQLPVDETDYRADDEVLMTASALDPAIPGRELVVRDVAAKSHLTSRRLGLMEVTS